MAARFELVLDQTGRFQFQLFAPDGDVLLTSAPAASKINAQMGVQHAREALRDPARQVRRVATDGSHYCELLDKRDALCARSARASTGIDLEALVARIGELGASAPLIDRTRKRPEQAAG